MNIEVSYEVSYDGKFETKNDEKLNRNSELILECDAQHPGQSGSLNEGGGRKSFEAGG